MMAADVIGHNNIIRALFIKFEGFFGLVGEGDDDALRIRLANFVD